MVRATPQDPDALTASDFGSIAFGTLYSGKHFVQDMVVGTDFVIPLDAALFGEFMNANTLTLALINGHELENVDHWPSMNVHTHFFTASPPSSGAPPLLRIVIESLFPVAIDIKPGEFPNTVNLRSRGNILVAMLSTSGFTAPTTVRMSSLTFGRPGDELSLNRCNTGDVNEDGLPDLICQFDARTAAFQTGDTKRILKGTTVEGNRFQGEDAVRIMP